MKRFLIIFFATLLAYHAAKASGPFDENTYCANTISQDGKYAVFMDYFSAEDFFSITLIGSDGVDYTATYKASAPLHRHGGAVYLLKKLTDFSFNEDMPAQMLLQEPHYWAKNPKFMLDTQTIHFGKFEFLKTECINNEKGN